VPFLHKREFAEYMGLDPARVRIVQPPIGGGFGSKLDIYPFEVIAVFLARATGRPVKLVYTREDDMAAGYYRPTSRVRFEAGLDDKGQPLMLRAEVASPSIMAASGFMKIPDNGVDSFAMEGIADHPYDIANQRLAYGRAEPGPQVWFWRSVGHSQNIFFIESFIDELALAAGQDPVAFRLQHLAEPRHAAVVKAAAEKAGWQPRVGANPDSAGSAGVLKGRGIAYAPRNGAVVAIVAEVEVQRATGQWRAARFVVAHDCGLVINPRSLEGVVESNILMALSRARHEEVRFDVERVKSVDWLSYPILDITEAPDSIELVIVGNQGTRTYGAGEPSTRPVAAALANALFDATGRRLRRVPFTPQRLLAALQARTA